MQKLKILSLIVLSLFLLSATPSENQKMYYTVSQSETTTDGPHIDLARPEKSIDLFQLRFDDWQIVHHHLDGRSDTMLVVPLYDKSFTYEETGVYYLIMNSYNLNTETYGNLIIEYYPHELGANSIHIIETPVHRRWFFDNAAIRRYEQTENDR